MPVQTVFLETEKLMKKTLERMQADFSTIRTGRPSPALVESIRVQAYGTEMPIQQVGTIHVVEGRTLEIRPWDASLLPELEKAVLMANLGVTPNNDGKVLRLVFPSLNEERRKELIKLVKKRAEEFRVSLRNERRDAIEKLRNEEKQQLISKDVRIQGEAQIQSLTDAYIKKVDEILSAKEKEILEI